MRASPMGWAGLRPVKHRLQNGRQFKYAPQQNELGLWYYHKGKAGSVGLWRA